MPEPLLEVCVDSIASALAAQQGGAQRIELCASLLEGGLSPTAGTMQVARHLLHIGINVMIRPRGGDFLYSDLDFAIMQRDIEIAKSLGADGVVFGILAAEGEIDTSRTGALVQLARPLRVTFHRAFDMVADARRGLDDLIALGIDRVLTSGQAATAMAGASTIAALVEQAAGRIVIMPGGGVNESNIAEILKQTGATEIHMSGRVPQASQMHYRNNRISLSSSTDAPDYSQQVTSADRIRASMAALRDADKPS